MLQLPYKYEKYKSFKMSQKEGISGIFKNFLAYEYFDTIIELGTWWGGFSYMLSDLVGRRLYSYDIKDFTLEGVKNLSIENGASFFIEDIFKSKNIKELITNGGRVLLLCDGGDKIREVKEFSVLLKTNDIIMAHDFFESKEVHDSDLWGSCEITSKDFDYSYLQTYKNYTNIFIPYVWGIRIKI